MSDAISQNLDDAALFAPGWARSLASKAPNLTGMNWAQRRQFVRDELRFLDPTESEIHAIAMALDELAPYSPPPVTTPRGDPLWE